MQVYNDTFVEELILKSNKGKVALLKLGTVALAVILLLASFIFFRSFFTFFFALICILCFFAFQYTRLEYEYSFTNGDFDIDKIMGKRKRSTVLSITCKDIVLMAPCGGTEEADNTKEEFAYRLDASKSTTAPDRCFFIFENDKYGGRGIVYFDPSERMLDAFHKYMFPRMKGFK